MQTPKAPWAGATRIADIADTNSSVAGELEILPLELLTTGGHAAACVDHQRRVASRVAALHIPLAPIAW